MPGTASTRNTDRDRLRSRPVAPRSTGVGAAAVEQPPILFRLPAIASVPADAELNSADEEHSALDQAAHEEPLHSVPLKNAPQVTAPVADAAIPRAPSQETIFETQICQLPPVGPSSVSPATSHVTPAEADNAAPLRTWWEHWSSGVVLILLIIALVTASIIALNDGGKTKPDHLASQIETSMADEFDLSNIVIPEIAPAALSVDRLSPEAPRSLSSVAAPNAIAHDQVSSAEHADGAVLPANSAVSSPELAISGPVAATPAGVASSPAPVAGGAAGIGGQPVADKTFEPSAAGLVVSGPAPVATLDQPVAVTAPQLFAGSESPTNASSGGGQGVPSMTASNPMPALELPNAVSPPGTAGGNAPAMDGSSPTFYDGASRTGEQHAAAAAGGEQAQPTQIASPAADHAGLVDTNMPSFSTILASATDNANAGGADSVFATASHTQAATPPAASGSPNAAAPAASMVQSATPDLNRESILNAYLRFQQLHQATSGEASNRYPSFPASVPQQNAVSPMQPMQSAPATGAGFTLGNPQAGAGIAPPLPR